MIGRRIRTPLVIAAAVSISACTSVPRDAGVGEVEQLLRDDNPGAYQLPRLGEPMPLGDDQLDQMLAWQISLESAERISIEANAAVKAKLASVGIAEADYAQAGRMENPGFTYERFSADDNSASLLFDVGGVLLMPLKRRMEARRLAAARYQAAIDVLAHIADTRRAWINAVAEKQQTALLRRAVEAAETSNNLTRQMTALGHSSVVESAQSELVLGEMRATLLRQEVTESAARETLIRQLGLWGDRARNLAVPDQLPLLPSQPIDFPAVEQAAIEQRLDVQMAVYNLESMASNLRLTRLNPFLSAIEFGLVREKAEEEVERGYEIELRLPIFDPGDVKTHKARIVFEQAQAQAEAAAVGAASSARQALLTYRSSWDIANHLGTQMLPLRQRVSAELLLRYNGMLISVFDLLSDLLAATTLEASHVNAVRDFWLADANLQSTLAGAGDGMLDCSGSAMMPAADDDGGH